MAICCWRFNHTVLRGDINIAVLGRKRTNELSNQLLGLNAGMRLSKRLTLPPSSPIRHIDGGRPYDGGEMLAFEWLELEAIPETTPELTVEISGRGVEVGVPVVLLPQLAALVTDSIELQLAADTWMVALIADESPSLIEGRLRVWTWTDGGLVVGAS